MGGKLREVADVGGDDAVGKIERAGENMGVHDIRGLRTAQQRAHQRRLFGPERQHLDPSQEPYESNLPSAIAPGLGHDRRRCSERRSILERSIHEVFGSRLIAIDGDQNSRVQDHEPEK